MSLRKALAQKDAHLHLIGIEDQGEDEGRVGRVDYFASPSTRSKDAPGKGDRMRRTSSPWRSSRDTERTAL